jgi:NADPH-dependent glutamate synthase beta subunit-like oxidoreductase
LSTTETATVDLMDALPTPFGLVRSGVAPDHPEVKNVTEEFERVAAQYTDEGRFRFIGNTSVGSDISLDDLRSQYDAVLLAYGASSDRMLGLEGEDLAGVGAARDFVNWYNGHPSNRDDTWGEFLSNTEDVVVVGQGNVAIDCARVLVKTPDELRQTDISGHALEALASSAVKRVHVVGRRGHVQAAFTMKELRELTRLDDAALVVRPEELDLGATEASIAEMGKNRAAKKIDALLRNTEACVHAGSAGAGAHGKSKEIHLRFLLNPAAIEGDGGGRVCSMEMDRTALSGEAGAQQAVATGEKVILPSQMMLRSIGYSSVPVEGLPFDERRKVARNKAGRVETEAGETVPGLYVTGWLKRGPSGIIGTNIVCAKGTVKALLADWEEGTLKATGEPTAVAGATDWAGWLSIDAKERADGEPVGKPREKMTRVPEMLDVAARR